jgi:ribosomal protein S18 acetylase RimI-like enzyme
MIRPYRISDKQRLSEIFNLNVPQFFASHELNEFLDFLADIKGNYFTILENNVIIGACGYEIRKEDHSGRINWIFFHPEFSGKGHGKMVVSYCENKLRSDPAVEVLIARTSQHACKFFQKCGYQLTETVTDFWAEGIDLYLMKKNI